MLRRRDLLRFGLASGFSALGANRVHAARRSASGDPPSSPRTTPFVQALPFPAPLTTVAPFLPDCPIPAQSDPARIRFYRIIQEERLVTLHPELPPTRVWGYRDANVARGAYPLVAGPTFIGRAGEPIVVRYENQLPADHVGFGEPVTTVHFHGGHVPAISDGFPHDIPGFEVEIEPGHTFDYCYPLLDPGFSTGEADPTDRPATMWYHDHILDFTGPNVYLGMAGFFLFFDELDSGSERSGLRLPSGEFDVPLLLQDRRLDRNGQLVYDGLIDHNGFLGDKFLVNGVIQPFLTVKRRKYRFRLLNGCNARFLGMHLVNEDGRPQRFDVIATEGGLMATTVRSRELAFMSPAQREDIVVDFSRFREGTVLYFEDRVDQDDGRGPEGTFEEPRFVRSGRRFLKIIVGPAAEDPSQVPDVLRPFEAISAAEIARATRREFVFDRRHGVWTVNGEAVDLERTVARARLNQPEVWKLVNKAGGWWHPVHVHLEFMHVLKRNGRRAVDDMERDGQAKRDVITLGPNGEVEVFFKFRDFPGPWVFHCHTLEHEDAFMMARFDVV